MINRDIFVVYIRNLAGYIFTFLGIFFASSSIGCINDVSSFGGPMNISFSPFAEIIVVVLSLTLIFAGSLFSKTLISF